MTEVVGGRSRKAWIGAALVAVLVSACGSGDGDGDEPLADPTTTVVPGPRGTTTFARLSQDHTTGRVEYPQVPPVGGAHNPAWQNCGFYGSPVTTEMGVHSMEHGAVWITFSPDLPANQVADLQSLANSDTHILVSAFPDLPGAVVASAWGRQLVLESAGDERLGEFVNAFREGPQTPEPGAPCVGGQGNPQ